MNKNIKINIQPVCDIQNNKIVYAEILVREYKGIDGAYNILEAVKNNNKQLELDLDIIIESLNYMNKYPNIEFVIAINIGDKTLEIINSSIIIDYIIEKSGADKNKIVLEVNENTNIKNKNVIRNILRLKKSNIRLAYDDFNMSKNSIKAIKSRLFDYIKIDKSILYYLENNNKNDKKYKRIINEINYIKNKYNDNIIIEGVETLEQLNISKELGIKHIQGFLFSKPINISSFNPYDNTINTKTSK